LGAISRAHSASPGSAAPTARVVKNPTCTGGGGGGGGGGATTGVGDGVGDGVAVGVASIEADALAATRDRGCAACRAETRAMVESAATRLMAAAIAAILPLLIERPC
jgi:hypothetical protein